MSFDDLPPLPPLKLPGAQDYAERISQASRRAMASCRFTGDVRYDDGDYWRKLDLYEPDQPSASARPVLCFLHGGAWRNGCKEWMGFMAPPVVASGALFISASYRHLPQAPFPAAHDDVCDLIAWLVRNVARWGGDPRRIHLGGHSAGGHLAALATLDHARLAERGLAHDAIRACHAVSGIYDLSTGRPHSLAAREILQGLLPSDADAAAASPIELIRSMFDLVRQVPAAQRRPALHVAWGSKDVPGFDRQAEAFVAALEKTDARVVAQCFDGYDHWATSECAADANHPWTKTMLAMLHEP